MIERATMAHFAAALIASGACNSATTYTGPGKGESRRLVLEVIDVVRALENVDVKVIDYADELRALIALQSDTRVKTAQRGEFPVIDPGPFFA